MLWWLINAGGLLVTTPTRAEDSIMRLIGRVNRRKIYYVQVRNNSEWNSSLPKKDWVAFTIANKEDEELVQSSIKVCIDKNVSYTCSAGDLGHCTEDYFDEEIAWRGVDYEMRTKQKFDYEKSPMTTAHKNFGEGFWFASTLANDDNFDINKVVCIDFTKYKVEKHLTDLVEKINNGWLPSDGDSEAANYDSK